MIGVGLSLTQPGKVAAAGGPPLSATITPYSLPWLDLGGDAFGTADFTAAVYDAVGTPSFNWEILSDTSNTPSYFQNGGTGAVEALGNDEGSLAGTVTLRCTVTATNGSVITNTVTVS